MSGVINVWCDQCLCDQCRTIASRALNPPPSAAHPPTSRETPLSGVLPLCTVGTFQLPCSQKQTPSSLPPHSIFFTAVTAMPHTHALPCLRCLNFFSCSDSFIWTFLQVLYLRLQYLESFSSFFFVPLQTKIAWHVFYRKYSFPYDKQATGRKSDFYQFSLWAVSNKTR